MTPRLLLLTLWFVAALSATARAQSSVTIDRQADRLVIKIEGRRVGEYVWKDPAVLRPYFAHLHTPGGVQVTRNHPPREGQDATDHAAMHPGLWLAFGDLSGADFWRNKGAVQHIEFIQEPQTTSTGGAFSVRNRYIIGGPTLCEEECAIQIIPRGESFLLDWVSQFRGSKEFTFGDQEEMGLGLRVASNLTVKNGGQILNSDGLTNEKQVWGKQADWCDYRGVVDGQSVGVAIFAHPQSFRRSWFHARDYGVLVANPFGQKAFTKGAPSSIRVKPGETFRLHFGVLVHSGNVDLPSAVKQWRSN